MAHPTRGKVVNDIALWVESVYNHIRSCSALGYHAPYEVELELLGYWKVA